MMIGNSGKARKFVARLILLTLCLSTPSPAQTNFAPWDLPPLTIGRWDGSACLIGSVPALRECLARTREYGPLIDKAEKQAKVIANGEKIIASLSNRMESDRSKYSLEIRDARTAGWIIAGGGVALGVVGFVVGFIVAKK